MSDSEREGKEKREREKRERGGERVVSKLAVLVAPMFVAIIICCVVGVIHVGWMIGHVCDVCGYLCTTQITIRQFN